MFENFKETFKMTQKKNIYIYKIQEIYHTGCKKSLFKLT